MLALLLGAQAASAPFWQLSDVIAISGVTRGGRVPFPQDDVLAGLVEKGDQTVFHAGDTITSPNGTVHKWVANKANDKGVLNQPQAGYVQAIVHSDTERPAVLTVTGDGMLYWNGAARPGDVYGYGYLSLPVLMHPGDNTLLIASGRGGLTARLEQPRASHQLNLGDPTLPDVLTSDRGELWGSVVVLNNAESPATTLTMRANIGDHSLETKLPEIAPYTLRKVPFRFPVVPGEPGSTQRVHLVLADGGEEDEGTLDVNVVAPLTTHKRTFISHIDGSLQYYAVVPALNPSKSNALVLTLHGASVEAIGQARAYKAKDWCTIVAPTNRRPYGFDWEDIGRLDALEVLEIAKKAYPHDPRRVVLTGHSMGGHGTWSIGTLYPNLFAAIAPSAGWVSFQSYAGGFRSANPTPIEKLFLDAAAPSDTLGRVRNTLEYKTYILHGDADDNVPVTEARTMRKALTDIGADFVYHEQPGAGHWWGNECVDWPPLFDLLKAARLKDEDDPSPIDFTTPNPQVSSTLRWVTIVRQEHAGLSSVHAEVEGGLLRIRTENVASLEVRRPRGRVAGAIIDRGLVGVKAKGWPLRLDHIELRSSFFDHSPSWRWSPGTGRLVEKNPGRYGGFKQAFQHNMVFVVGTHGDEANKLMGFARYLAESLYYRGNGAVDVWTDDDYMARRKHDRSLRDRNVILFGNLDDNTAWRNLMPGCEVRVRGAAVYAPTFADKVGSSALITFPLPGSNTAMIGAFGVSQPAGVDVLERLPILPSGGAYPDWTVFDPREEPGHGIKSVVLAGNFGPDWSLKIELP